MSIRDKNLEWDEYNLPCPCGKSSDAYSTNKDGSGKCFSCGKFFPGDPIVVDDSLCTFEYVELRGISQDVMRKYDVRTKVGPDGTPIEVGFSYTHGWKVRKLNVPKKEAFRSVDDTATSPLFGSQFFSSSSSRSITLTEGEFDALAAYQMLGSKYPVISVRSSSSARKDCEKMYEYINSFERIYLCFDNDANGQKATKEVAALFDWDKVYHVKFSKHKDANDFLLAGEEREFKNAWYGAGKIVPDDIVASYSAIDDILDNDSTKEGFPYPWPTLDNLTYGIRTGEVTLFTALEGRGKTEIIRAIEYKILKETDDNIAIIHLEESKARAIKGLVGLELKRPVHFPDSGVNNERVKEEYRKITKRDERVYLYSHFGSSDPSVIVDTIRFLVTVCRCKYVFLDHITMVVSGLDLDDERRALDRVSTALENLAEDLDFALIEVSHVNDDGLTRGSRNISKTAATWIHLERNVKAESLIERNTTYLTINKNRFGANTGPAGRLYFDLETFSLEELPPEGELPS